jgi:peptide/nickel transport system ATP-binding protein
MSAPYVEVRGLTHRFDLSGGGLARLLPGHEGRSLRAVDDVSFGIDRGETFALVGESGSGKSTIARIVAGLYPTQAGVVRVDGVPVGQRRGRGIQMIFQDPYASLNPRWRVESIVAEPIREMPGPARRARVGELLELVGLHAADGRKYAHQFSGGQRQRVAIARALAAEAPLLVCDEPTSALDVSVQAQILNLMRELQERLGLTYLFISHNLAVVRYMAARVGVLYLGRLVEVAEVEDIFTAPRHPYTRMLLDAVPGTGRARDEVTGAIPSPLAPPPGCTFHPRCPLAGPRCRREIPAALDGVACHAVHGGTG